MNILIPLSLLLFLISLIKDRKKSKKALKIAWKKFSKVLPSFIYMLALISLSLSLVPQELIADIFDNKNISLSVILASLIGSISMMPGFVAFPLCGILLKKGISYMVLSAFTTTMMMVGIITYPLEKSYFGHKITIIRNLAGLFIAVLVSLITGLIYGEISL